MPFHTVSLGDYEIISIQAQADRMVGATDMFPDITPLALEAGFASMPRFFGETPNDLRFTQNICVVKHAGLTTLVDTGIPVETPGAMLLEGLAEAAIPADSIDLVILTHRDLDHVGGNLRDGKPVYPNARYVIGRFEYEAFQMDQARAENFPKFVGALESLGRLEIVTNDAEVSPGIRLWLTPGHRSGATSVLVGDVALLLADVWHAAIQVSDPSLSIKFDSDLELAAETRMRVIERAEREDLLVAVPHTPFFGLGRIQHQNGVRAWHPIC